MPTSQGKQKSWFRHAQLALRKRWVQVCLMVLIWGFAVALTISSLAPKPVPPGKESERYKFLHCDKCKTEIPYNPELDKKRCPKCPPPNTGFFFPTERSIKEGEILSPWRYVYVAVLIESLCLLGAVVHLLSRSLSDPRSIYYVLPCPHCGQRLRYRGVSLGQIGSCARCKRMIRFPEEEEALPEEELLKIEEEVAREMAAQAQAEADAQADAQEQALAEAEALAYAQAQAEAEGLAAAEAQAQAEAEAAAQAEAEAAQGQRPRKKKKKRQA